MTRLRSWVAAGIVGFAGCAANIDREFGNEVARLNMVEPPTFLNGDLASVFGAANFSARVSVQKGSPGTRRPVEGEISGREGSLFFIADEQKGRRGLNGGLSALWDAKTQTAYMFNDPLQGYAPMRNGGTNGPMQVAQLGEETVNGQLCRKSVVHRTVGAESLPVLIVWRSPAHQDLPLRVQSTNSAEAVTLTLSRIRAAAPPADLFTLPDGFRRYDSTDAMLSELTFRQTEALSAKRKNKQDRLGTTTIDDSDPRHPGRSTRPY